MLAVVADQFWWHGLDLATKEHVEEQGFKHVVAVMAKCNPGCANFAGGAVDDATTQAGTQRARRLAFGDLVLDDRIGVLGDDSIFNADGLEVSRQDVVRKPRLFLIQVHCDDAEIDRCPFA
ncbi:hypothetical protein SDC9_205466 [bioreactor metagenome]|uniref:Uncharacterized protein n=1 Tax=bioreactor metagenome TaxID=1076179 RepID=A0A645J3T7_9ZZZZ